MGLCPAKAHENRCRSSKMREIHWYKGTHGENASCKCHTASAWINTAVSCCHKATRSVLDVPPFPQEKSTRAEQIPVGQFWML